MPNVASEETAASTTQRRPRKKRPSLSAVDSLLRRLENNHANSKTHSWDPMLSRNVLMGLTVAGVAQALLTTIFRLFHVDVFLEAYQLPLESYSNGSLAVSIITTISSVVGAWMVDKTATRKNRTTSVGQTGIYFVACFLTPFFAHHARWGTWHFIITVSLYQTLYSYTTILLGSIVTDSHTMTQATRVKFMASGKAWNLVASFVVGRIALSTFREDNLHAFRVFLGGVAAVTLFLFVLADSMIQGTWLWHTIQSCCVRYVFRPLPWLLSWRKQGCSLGTMEGNHNGNGFDGHNSSSTNLDLSVNSALSSHSQQQQQQQPKKLHWRRIVRDFRRHHNFRVWVVMEMLLHMQINFNANFLKTFVDSLLVQDFGRDTCDWLLSLVGPVSQFVTIVAYIPIQKWGYPKVYLILFVSNFLLSNILFWWVGDTSSYGIMIFLMVYCVSTRAVQSAGFHLAMADMVLEMKRKHANDGRYDEPSVAGLFMGANALLCVSFRKHAYAALTSLPGPIGI